MNRNWRIQLILWVLMVGLLAARPTGAQDETAEAAVALRVARVDTAAFPQINVYLAAANPLQPLPDELVGLRLREGDEPITELTAANVAVGLDLIFVVDANDSITNLDGNSQLTRLEKVQRSVLRFATEFMDGQGRDRISVIVPDETEENGRFLLQNVTTPGDVVEGMLAYAPTSVTATPLAAMLDQAITQLAQQENDDGRFQAILLFTDGAQLDRQLDFAALTAPAQAANIPIFAAILGARADPNEIDNVMQLAGPSGGDYLHMPEPEETDPFYTLWQQQRSQAQITFTSAQRRSGAYTLAIFYGDTAATAVYELVIEPPTVSLLLQPGSVLRRAANADDTVADLTPTSLPLPLVITWPVGAPRALTAVTLLLDGEPFFTLPQPEPDANGSLLLAWDLRTVTAGAHELIITVTDELGLTASTEPVLVTLLLELPPTPVPTAIPEPTRVSAETAVTTVVTDNPALVSIALGLLLLLAALLWLQRRRQQRVTMVNMAQELADIIAPDPLAARQEVAAEAAASTAAPAQAAYLEWLDEARPPLRLSGESVTIGRDPQTAVLVIDDDTISQLHARIKRSGDAYWLYDEGSASGTYLNFDRLGLGPRMLHDQNRVQFGRLRFLFRLRPEEMQTAPDDDHQAADDDH